MGFSREHSLSFILQLCLLLGWEGNESGNHKDLYALGIFYFYFCAKAMSKMLEHRQSLEM